MSKIHLLTEQVCNKIAAGEVVERPASVVKELMENSLDAGALKVSVSVEKAGRKLISVTDNGEGMDGDDAMLCLESHATSKIRDDADIFAITSFGFRGEAVPSIAAVSKFTLRTRRRDTPEGAEVVVHAGKLIASHPAGCAPGTEITVRDLFFNLPARRKFMRADATEERHIMECVTNMALAHPEAAFELKFDGRTMIASPASDQLRPRLHELFGKDYADNMLPVSKNEYGIQVTGFISKRTFTRNSRNEQRTFVNGRCVESNALYRGIREGCGPTLERGRYQVAVLFLSLAPGEVDVNVHPAKREVRFRREFEVIAAVRSAISAALRIGDPVLSPGAAALSGNDNASLPFPSHGDNAVTAQMYPNFAPGACLPGADSDAPRPVRAQPLEAKLPPHNPATSLGQVLASAYVAYQPMGGVFTASPSAPSPAPESLFPAGSAGGTDEEKKEESEPVLFRLSQEDVPEGQTPGGPGVRILGILENSYLVGTIPGGLVLIDQHAAHERVLFERILKGEAGVHMQKLLLPITVEVSRAEMLFVTRYLDDFSQIGFEIEPFGQNTIKLNGIPSAIPQNNAGGMFRDLLSRVESEGAAQKNAVERIARAACKAAVKAHDRLSMEECDALVRQLAKCEMPFCCPHGRPTILNISMNEIERRFGRK